MLIVCLHIDVVHVLKQTSSHSGSNDLLLTNVTLDDSGIYTCYAATTLGETYKSAWLTVTRTCKLCFSTCLSLFLMTFSDI